MENNGYLRGNSIPNKYPCYQIGEFEIISIIRITQICQDKFGAVKVHDGHTLCLVFNKNIIEKLKVNYSQIRIIKILDNTLSVITNTFNTFWKDMERNDTFKNNFNVTELTKSIPE
jgi:hypothetical protein